MPMAGVNHAGYRPQSARNRAIGGIRPSRGVFNNFPAIAAAFPDVIAEIVEETTDELALKSSERAPEAAIRRYQSDPEPGTLKDSWDVRVKTSKTTGDTISGRVTFTAKDPDGHLFPYFVEVGTATHAAQPFLVPTLQEERPIFNHKLASLESRLPR